MNNLKLDYHFRYQIYHHLYQRGIYGTYLKFLSNLLIFSTIRINIIYTETFHLLNLNLIFSVLKFYIRWKEKKKNYFSNGRYLIIYDRR